MRPAHRREHGGPSAPDARDTDWYRVLVDIDNMRAAGRGRWAARTLDDIRIRMEETGHVTDAQRRAVALIAAGDWRRADWDELDGWAF